MKSKRGGNVASYFLTPDGRVLGAALGAVDAETFMEEARWALEAHADPAAAHRARAELLKKNPLRTSAPFT